MAFAAEALGVFYRFLGEVMATRAGCVAGHFVEIGLISLQQVALAASQRDMLRMQVWIGGGRAEVCPFEKTRCNCQSHNCRSHDQRPDLPHRSASTSRLRCVTIRAVDRAGVIGAMRIPGSLGQIRVASDAHLMIRGLAVLFIELCAFWIPRISLGAVTAFALRQLDHAFAIARVMAAAASSGGGCPARRLWVDGNLDMRRVIEGHGALPAIAIERHGIPVLIRRKPEREYRDDHGCHFSGLPRAHRRRAERRHSNGSQEPTRAYRRASSRAAASHCRLADARRVFRTRRADFRSRPPRGHDRFPRKSREPAYGLDNSQSDADRAWG